MDPHHVERLLGVIEHRHSARAPFDPTWRVSEHELANIVEAARWAPTAHNMQNFQLVAVGDRRIPLVRWPTTIGGWQDQNVDGRSCSAGRHRPPGRGSGRRQRHR